jgi:hypothetical protein
MIPRNRTPTRPRPATASPRPELRALDRRLLIAGLLLLLGGVVTLSLHAAGAPEALLDFLYGKLLSGLDVPPDPSQTAKDIVNYASLAGGVVELVAGAALVSWSARPAGSPAGR